MEFDRRFGVVVGCSLVWALIVSAVFYRLAVRAASRPPVSAEKPLVIAAAALPFGAVISAGMVKTVRAPEKMYPAGGHERVEDVVGRPVISPIHAGEAVVEARLAARGSGIGLAPMIPPGMRAVAVRVNDVAGVAGFVLPGMRVDVLVTGRPSGREDTVTSTALENIVVLSAGQTLESDGKSSSINVPVVTLLATPEQAETLSLANTEGKIQLVLRNSTDQKMSKPPGRQLREIFGGSRVRESEPERPAEARALPRPAAPRRQAPPPPEPVRVETKVVEQPAPSGSDVVVIRGSQRTVETAPARKGS
jgi:pilus assembly protein CpaB